MAENFIKITYKRKEIYKTILLLFQHPPWGQVRKGSGRARGQVRKGSGRTRGQVRKGTGRARGRPELKFCCRIPELFFEIGNPVIFDNDAFIFQKLCHCG